MIIKYSWVTCREQSIKPMKLTNCSVVFQTNTSTPLQYCINTNTSNAAPWLSLCLSFNISKTVMITIEVFYCSQLISTVSLYLIKIACTFCIHVNTWINTYLTPVNVNENFSNETIYLWFNFNMITTSYNYNIHTCNTLILVHSYIYKSRNFHTHTFMNEPLQNHTILHTKSTCRCQWKSLSMKLWLKISQI